MRICSAGPFVEHFGQCEMEQWRTQELFSGGGVQQIQLTEDRENGDLGA